MNTEKRMTGPSGRTVKMMILIASVLLLQAAVAQAATYHVTTTTDNGDNLNPTPGSLRKAIVDANANSGPDSIDFQIPGAGVKTISPLTPLPLITDPVTIDGYTQPGASPNTLTTGNNAVLLIELDGSSVVPPTIFDAIGLSLKGTTSGAGTTIRGLVINRFGYYGIYSEPGDEGGNKIEGCFIGTDPTGNIARPNAILGIYFNGSDNNVIGGTTPAARNLISGNADPMSGNGYGILISGNSSKQVSGNVVQGNYIGTNAAGTAKLGNFSAGIALDLTSDTIIGGTTVAARNVVSGNAYGVYLTDSKKALVQGNYIGTDVTGTVALGNNSAGVVIYNSADNTIGGSAAGARNLISGNTDSGILIDRDASTGNAIQGNYIGTDVTGNAALGNGTGIYFNSKSPSNNKIGGTSPGEGNLISGNSFDGILFNADNPASNTVQGNLIGTNAAGTAAVPNINGISLYFTSGSNLIGGSAVGAGNIISGNSGKGIFLYGAKNQVVQGNRIGTDANGAALGNGDMGISIQNDAQNNTIGGTTAGTGNTIAFNKGGGVVLKSANDTGNMINGNAIYQNVGPSGGLGIDLFWDGVTQNDLNDATPGPNNLQNFPVLTSVVSGNGSTTITGTLNSTANKLFRIEFFASAQCNPSGFGEGQVFLGASNVSTVGNNASINATLPVTVQQGSFITATATDPAGNTSEFSQCLTLGAAPQPGSLQFSVANYSAGESNGQATIVVTRTGGSSGAVSVQYATSNNGASATPGTDYTAASGTLNWASGDVTSKTFNVSITGDSVDENNETVNLVLSNPTGGATLGNQSTAVLTIVDDDDPALLPTISIGDATATEGNGALTNMTFTLLLSASSNQDVTVSYATADGTAKGGTDYEPVSSSVTFTPGQMSKTINVLIKGDTVNEPNETFFVNLSNVVNNTATISDGQGQGNILNDDQPIIQFAQAAYSVTEGQGRISITVTRGGDAAGTAAIFFNTADASAVQKNDFSIAIGRLRFAPGEASKSFDIFITDDAYVEGPESFSITLSEPESVSLGAAATTVVTINDNDLAPSASNPVDNADFFVRQHYVDFLNREPEPQGFADWKAILNNCAPNDTKCDRIEVSSDFFRSPEFYDRGYFVYRFYETALGRKPDYLEFMPGLRKVTGFLSPQELEAAKVEFIAEFMDTTEYKQKYNGIVDAGVYVDTLTQTAGITLSNRNALVQALQTNQKTRAQVLREVVESAEVGAKFYNKAFVVMQYFGYLRRDPDALYLNWIETLNQTGDYRVMVNGFMNSPEYRQRFNQ